MDATPPPPAALRLEHCPRCGYALEGLPDVGTCPECGGAYDQDAVVLHGWARGSKVTVANARPLTAILIVLAYAAWIAYWVTTLVKTHAGRRDYFVVVVPLAVLCGLVWVAWRRWTNHLPGPLQVRLNARGCAQQDAPSAAAGKLPSPTPWTRITSVTIKQTRTGTHRLRCRASGKWFAAHDVVDAELRCTPEQAAALARRIAEWQGSAKAALPLKTPGAVITLKSR